ncbi:hypothetical protein D3C73_929960 [compost metagenome]
MEWINLRFVFRCLTMVGLSSNNPRIIFTRLTPDHDSPTLNNFLRNPADTIKSQKTIRLYTTDHKTDHIHMRENHDIRSLWISTNNRTNYIPQLVYPHFISIGC